MSQELIYTSAPRGLRPGNQGFCTVAATQGMSSLLIERLESLSVYPREAASVGAVVHSHFRISLGGKLFHVLSRIQGVQTEYTGRTNHLAQHLVLEPHELAPGGPAWLLAQGGLWLPGWGGEPRWLAPRKNLSGGGPPAAPCRRWQQVMGDAGWAGVLIEGFVQAPDALAYVIFEHDQELLPLFGEAVALLSDGERWGVTFTTFYYPQLGPEAPCLWRGVLRGSAAAKRVRSTDLVLDLTRPNGQPAASPWVVSARTGKCPPSLPLLQPTTPSNADLSATAGIAPLAPRVMATAPAVRHGPERPYNPAVKGDRKRWERQRAGGSTSWLRLSIAFAAGVLLAALLLTAGGFAFYRQREEVHTAEEKNREKAARDIIAKHKDDSLRLKKTLSGTGEERDRLRLDNRELDEKNQILEKHNQELQGRIRQAKNDAKTSKARLEATGKKMQEFERNLRETRSRLEQMKSAQAARKEIGEATYFLDLPRERPPHPIVLKSLDLEDKGGGKKLPEMSVLVLGASLFRWENDRDEKKQTSSARITAFPRRENPTGKAEPICSIEIDDGKWLKLAWKDRGEDKEALLQEMCRSVLSVRSPSSGKRIYVSFWRPRKWGDRGEVYPPGLSPRDIYFSLGDVVLDENDRKNTIYARYYTVIEGVRVYLWEASPRVLQSAPSKAE